MSFSSLIQKLPKAELHLHIEGSLTPELMWHLAKKHNITLPYKSVEEIAAAYQFSDLQSFLDIYYAGAGVLIDDAQICRVYSQLRRQGFIDSALALG